MKKIRCHYCGADTIVENHVNLSLCSPCKVKAGYDPIGFALSLEKPITKNGIAENRSADKVKCQPLNDSDAGGMLLASCLAGAMADNASRAQGASVNESFGGGESGGAGADGTF